MKREGRQHGMVRTFRILPSPSDPRTNTRIFNGFDAPPTAGLFTKVPSKPTNHSKFTGKCGRARCSECYLHPACKSKDKTKGNNKIKSFDLASHRMVTWRVVDDRLPGLSLSGSSASGLLDQLVDDYDCCHDDDDGDDSTRSGLGLILAADDDEDEGLEPADPGTYKNDIDDDEKLDIYEVGFILDHVEEEGDWCLVGEP